MNRKEKDILWLGEEYASLGPAVRAALGILLERGEWGWWDARALIPVHLEKAVWRNGPVSWGGDASVLNAEQWVDPLRAIALGRAFESLSWREMPAIKLSRSVWDWEGGADTIASVLSELSLLVGPGYVFPEWQRNAKPRFPRIHKERPRSYVAAGPDLPLENLLVGESEQLSWELATRRDDVVDILVVSNLESLRAVAAAKLVIVQGNPLGSVLAQVSRLRDDLSAQCVLQINADNHGVIHWLHSVLWLWSYAGMTFVQAVRQATDERGLQFHVLSSTQSFLNVRGGFPEDSMIKARRVPDPVRRDPGPDRLTPGVIDSVSKELVKETPSTVPPKEPPPKVLPPEITERPVEDYRVPVLRPMPDTRPPSPSREAVSRPRRPVKPRPSPPIERVLTASARQGQNPVDYWPTTGQVELDLAIVVKTPLQSGTPTFPEDRIEWVDDYKGLQIHLFEFGQAPVTRPLYLPKTDGSGVVTFIREGRCGEVDLRFVVSDGAQILQTARLQAKPNETISFFIENVVTPLHREKKTFDLALLVNDSLGNQPSVSIITQAGKPIFVPLGNDEIAEAPKELLFTLQSAVNNPEADLAPLMMDLANDGALLQRVLTEREPQWPGSEGRLQLVSQDHAFFPIEYLYDGPIPPSRKAPLCSQRVTCLKRGSAEPGCGIRKAREQLCPMGFLGISGIIERHTWTPGQAPNLWNRPPVEQPGRHRIDDLSKVVFTASDRADVFWDGDVEQEVVRLQTIETALAVKRVATWEDWTYRLELESPSMLLMILHKDKNWLYTGAEDSLSLGGMSEQHVGGAPLVIAIGCSTGLGEMPGSSLPAILRNCGASVVIAAMTSVLGRHANRVARDLAKHLRQAASAWGTVHIGEIISALRRQLLIEGVALGLAVVAFGDADIALGKDGR
ncbi:hypothetical protein [Pseudomonas sp. BJa3]|uniref:hypothetical protein n=1 Tax=Pseudomonas sp. BJa3 TaxID=2986525 RepID=UPI002265C610|nr:hypothetical protein [Pseudomonas sp. BJa3]MCX5508316.1 hypothetical protein [Pseudomonas sp. BJa3]